MAKEHRAWWLLGLAGWVGLMLAALALALMVFHADAGLAYPGAVRLADETFVGYTAGLSVRRITTYRTDDGLAHILSWYASEFSLGASVRPQGGCIVSGRTLLDLWMVERRLSVALCETTIGQTITVRRVWRVHWR